MSEGESTAERSDAADEPAGRGLRRGVPPFEAPIEPGSPSLENAAFVLLGVFVALGVVLRLFQLFG